MITAVDSSVVLDVLTDSPGHRQASLEALEKACRAGSVVVCPVVWAEVRAAFDDVETMAEALEAASITFDTFDRASSDLAGALWKEYRRQGGTRRRLISDFLVAAHAQVQADGLLTRDRGFSRRYFQDLEVIDPPAENAKDRAEDSQGA